MPRLSWKRRVRTVPGLLAGLLASTLGLAAPLDIPDTPLFLRSLGVAPNLVLTLDDSASMMSAFLPDDWRVPLSPFGTPCSPNCVNVSYGGSTYGIRYAATNRFKSSDFNPMYYNPFVKYEIPTRPDSLTVYSTSFGAARKNGFVSTSATVDLNSQYRAQIDYTRDGGADWTTDATGAQAYYYRFCEDKEHPLSCPMGCDGTTSDDDCYIGFNVSATSGPSSDIGPDERQNFANWYSFYRTRALATQSAAMLAMSTVEFEKLRLGWQTLNCAEYGANCCNTLAASDSYTCKAINSDTNFDNRIRIYDAEHSTRFLNWLERTAPPAPSTDTGTPLRTAMIRAGEYFKTTGVNSPYAETPQVSAGTQYSCRRNYHLLMTDGIWNDPTTPTSADNFDGKTAYSLPDGTLYSARPPFEDSQADTLADIAALYWATDLLPGASDTDPDCTGSTCDSLVPYEVDRVTPTSLTTPDQIQDSIYWNPRNDPATWQHMTNFTVSLGLGKKMADPVWGGDTFAGDYSALALGIKPWPTLNFTIDDPNKAYDLWHAAINSRGEFFSPEDPNDLKEDFKRILDTISARSAVSGGAGLSSSSTGTDGMIFEAKNNADWSAQLQARTINQTDYSLDDVIWDAGQLIPTNPERAIYSLDDAGDPIAFLPNSCAGELETVLGANPTAGKDDGYWCERRVNWLRGDGKVTKATCSGTSAPGTLTVTIADHGFREGDQVTLSDIRIGTTTSTTESTYYNGAFSIVSATADTFSVSIANGCETLGYAGSGRARYSLFRDRPTSVLGDILGSDPVYVSDDDQGYGSSPVLNGSDEYADYVEEKNPETKPPMLYAGANDGMLHAFRADAGNLESGVEQFAYVPRGVHANLSALTDPSYRHKFSVDGPAGVGDAYNGTDWKTYLVGALGAGGKSVYALDITDPMNFTADQVQWEITASDLEALGLVFGRPQIAPSGASQWDVFLGNGYNSTKEQAALIVIDLAKGDPDAITAGTSLTSNGLSTPYLHDSNGDSLIDVIYAGDLRGRLWKFVNDAGTWKLGNAGQPLFIAENDAGIEQPVTSQPKVGAHPEGGVLIYFGTGRYLTDADNGNHDQQSFYAIRDTGEDAAPLTRADLQGHSVSATLTVGNYEVRTTTQGAPDWTTQHGWYLDLPVERTKPSERILSTPLLLEFVSPNVPDRILFVTNTPTADPCSNGGTTWLMELNPITGEPTATSVFDLDNNGVFDARDLVDTGGDDSEATAISGVALSTGYGMASEPLTLETPNPKGDGNLVIKEFSGSTGVSGPGGAPMQQGESGSIQQLYWRQIQ